MAPYIKKKDRKEEPAADEAESAGGAAPADTWRKLRKRVVKSLKSDDIMILDEDIDISHVHTFVSTGCTALDYIASNRRNGGLPVGTIVAIEAMPATGKSLLATHICANTQKMGGFPVYIDMEHAFQPDFAKRVGLDVENNFWLVKLRTLEEVFKFLFDLGHSIDEMKKLGEWDYKFVTVIWDTVAASPPQLELDAENPDPGATVGLVPRIISKNIKNFLGNIAAKDILFVCINQLRNKINVQPFQDPYVAPGGNAIPFYASTYLRLASKAKLKSKDEEIVGILTTATVKKTRFGPPHRKCEFPIYFTNGVDDPESIINCLLAKKAIQKINRGKNGTFLKFEGEPEESAIPKTEFKKKFLSDEVYRNKVLEVFEHVMAVDLSNPGEQELSETDE